MSKKLEGITYHGMPLSKVLPEIEYSLGDNSILKEVEVKHHPYKHRRPKMPETKSSTSRVKIYNQDEKFQYLLQSIGPEFIVEFKSIKQASRDKLYRLLITYQKLPSTFTSSDIKPYVANAKDTSRTSLMLRQAQLVEVSTYKRNGEQVFMKTKIAKTDIEVLEQLILSNEQIIGFSASKKIKAKNETAPIKRVSAPIIETHEVALEDTMKELEEKGDEFDILRDKFNYIATGMPELCMTVDEFLKLYLMMKE